MRKLTSLIIFLAAAVVALPQQTPMPKTSSSESDAQKVFEKMKPLAGSWEGSIMGRSVQVTISLVSGGSAIMHDFIFNKRGSEITMFYVEGDRLLVTHYCEAGNRSRMEGKMSPDGKSIEFSFLDVVGTTQRGFVKGMRFTMIDPNHHIVEMTYIQPDGKPLQAQGEFQRTK